VTLKLIKGANIKLKHADYYKVEVLSRQFLLFKPVDKLKAVTRVR